MARTQVQRREETVVKLLDASIATARALPTADQYPEESLAGRIPQLLALLKEDR